jgi:hypothetical protein
LINPAGWVIVKFAVRSFNKYEFGTTTWPGCRISHHGGVPAPGYQDLEERFSQGPFAGDVLIFLSRCIAVADLRDHGEGYPGDRGKPRNTDAGVDLVVL